MTPCWRSAWLVSGAWGSLRATKAGPACVTEQSSFTRRRFVRVRAGRSREYVSTVSRRARDPALAVRRLDVGIEHVRVHGRDREPDPPQLLFRQPRGHLFPRLAAVGASMDRALPTAIDQREEVTAALISGDDDHVGIPRIDNHIGHPRVLRDSEDLRPRVPPVG